MTKNKKKELIKKENKRVTVEVVKAVDGVFVLIFVIMLCFPNIIEKINNIAQNGDEGDIFICSMIVAMVISFSAGLVTFGKESLKNRK